MNSTTNPPNPAHLPDGSTLTDRAIGCLLGLAVGDAFGDIGRSDAYRQRYGIVTNLYEGAKSTDDTEFAVLTGQTLLDCGGDLTLDHLVTSWKKYIIDQGGVFERGGKPLYGAVANLERGMLPPYTGIDNVQNNDDGAVMRIAPIGIICAGDPQRAADLALIEAQISHAQDGIWGAQAVAASIAVALTGATVDEIVNTGLAQIPEDSWLGRAMAKTIRICDEAGSIEAAWEDLHTALWTPVHSSVAEALPQLYAVFKLTGGDFHKGMFWAGNFGRDADTIGAVVGALSGAMHGESVIPATWIEKVRCPAGVCLKFAAQIDIRELAQQLVELIP
ncbi:MAG: ADP-ribosylglycohydrolase family protein [Anaerolineae bacterium]|nr:ADP-ribosylglycohydrolase family protein [Anaerolineae bacterium]